MLRKGYTVWMSIRYLKHIVIFMYYVKSRVVSMYYVLLCRIEQVRLLLLKLPLKLQSNQ